VSAAKPDPYLPSSSEARALAASLLSECRYATLAVTEPDLGTPFISRIALALLPSGGLVSLLSGLSLHTRALKASAACALLIGEVGDKGDPLVHPRLSLRARASFVPRSDDALLRKEWLAILPKAKLYVDLPDFQFVRFEAGPSLLNGGFARAWLMQPDDLGLT
jgi:putative heme iron utilization protein